MAQQLQFNFGDGDGDGGESPMPQFAPIPPVDLAADKAERLHKAWLARCAAIVASPPPPSLPPEEYEDDPDDPVWQVRITDRLDPQYPKQRGATWIF